MERTFILLTFASVNKQLIFNSRVALDTTESKMKIELNSSICPLVDFSTYETPLSASFFEDYGRDCIGDFETVSVNQEDVDVVIMEKVAAVMQDDIAPVLVDYGVKSINIGELYRPKEYNFRHDSFDFSVEMKEDWKVCAITFLEKNLQNKNLCNYIQENWVSRSGFWSFMPESIESLVSTLKGNDTRYTDDYLLGAYLTLVGLETDVLMPCQVFEDMVFDEITENTDLTASYCYIPNDWLELYNDDVAVDELYYNLLDKIGHVWRGMNAIYDTQSCESYDCNDNASRMIAWAMKNNISVEDAQDIAAGRKVYEYGMLMYA